MSAPTTATKGAVTQTRPFGLRDKIGYMFGDFGNDFTFVLQAAFFMIFFTNVVGIKPAHVGTLLLAARVVDGFTDIGMGMLVDRLPGARPGYKFRRWLKYICVPVAVASALMYMSFAASFSTYGLKLVWMCAVYFLWGSVCYTAINIPYGSMASVISDNPDHRAELSVFRSTGATLGNIAIMTILPLFVYKTNADGVSYLDGPSMTVGAAVCSVLAVGCYVLCYFLVEERVQTTSKSKSEGGMGVGQLLASIFSNRALLGLIACALLLLVSSLFMGSMIGYLMLSYFGNGKLQSPASMAALVPTLLLVVIAPWLSRRFGKAEVGAAATFAAGLIMVITYFLHVTNPTVWIALYGVSAFCMGIFNYLVWAFITDVIDYQEVRTGQRDDGTVYAVYSWSRKLGQALAGGATGWALGWIGYDAAAAKAGVAQAVDVVDGVYMLGNLVPGIGYILVSLAIIFLYPLKKKVVDGNNAILAQRRAQA